VKSNVFVHNYNKRLKNLALPSKLLILGGRLAPLQQRHLYPILRSTLAKDRTKIHTHTILLGLMQEGTRLLKEVWVQLD